MDGTTAVVGFVPYAAPSTASPPHRPPRWPVLAAGAFLCASVAAAVLAVFGGYAWSVAVTGTGYLAGSILVAVFAGVHQRGRQQAIAFNNFELRRVWAAVARIVLVLGLLAGTVNAVLLATEIAKRW